MLQIIDVNSDSINNLVSKENDNNLPNTTTVTTKGNLDNFTFYSVNLFINSLTILFFLWILDDSVPSTSALEKKVDGQPINLDQYVWKKLSNVIIQALKNGDRLTYPQRKTVIHLVVDYMIDELQDTSRGMANEIAKIMSNTYPHEFLDTVGNERWGSGHDSLRLGIYNTCLYKVSRQKGRKKRPFIAISNDSDDEDKEKRDKECARIEKQDEYGCVDLAPSLPEDKTRESQEEKKAQLQEFFRSGEYQHANISKLMDDTYPTLRAELNNKKRDLEKIVLEWPFLKENSIMSTAADS